jgi:hypothetical protein
MLRHLDPADRQAQVARTMTDKDVARNTRAVAHAIGQQKLEGLTVPAATERDLYRVASGEMPLTEAIRNVYAQFGNVPVFQP